MSDAPRVLRATRARGRLRDAFRARSTYRYAPSEEQPYRRAMGRFLEAVHAVNTKPLREHARAFDGLM